MLHFVVPLNFWKCYENLAKQFRKTFQVAMGDVIEVKNFIAMATERLLCVIRWELFISFIVDIK
jgi:hypothetical protein